MRNSLDHKRNNTGETKDSDVWHPIKGQCVIMLRRGIDVPEWGVRVWLGHAE